MSAQTAATQDDLHATEARLASAIANLTVAMAAVSTHLSQLDAQFAGLQTNDTATQALVSTMQHQLTNATLGLTLATSQILDARNQSFEENQAIFSTLTNSSGGPLLPAVVAQNEAIQRDYLRMRGDQSAILSNLTSLRNEQEKNSKQIYAQASASEAASVRSNWMSGVSLAAIAIVVSVVTRQPSALYKYVDVQKRRTEKRWSRGHGIVAPDCPKQGTEDTTIDGAPLQLGEYHGCPFNATCEQAAACKALADRMTIEAMEGEAAVADLADRDMAQVEETTDEAGKPVIRITPPPGSIDLNSLGSA